MQRHVEGMLKTFYKHSEAMLKIWSRTILRYITIYFDACAKMGPVYPFLYIYVDTSDFFWWWLRNITTHVRKRGLCASFSTCFSSSPWSLQLCTCGWCFRGQCHAGKLCRQGHRAFLVLSRASYIFAITFTPAVSSSLEDKDMWNAEQNAYLRKSFGSEQIAHVAKVKQPQPDTSSLGQLVTEQKTFFVKKKSDQQRLNCQLILWTLFGSLLWGAYDLQATNYCTVHKEKYLPACSSDSALRAGMIFRDICAHGVFSMSNNLHSLVVAWL